MDRYIADSYILEKIASLLKIGIYKASDESLSSFQDNNELNPIYQSRELRLELIQMADNQELPVIYKDEFLVHFGCIKVEDSYYFFGPMATEKLDRPRLHAFYRSLNVTVDIERSLKKFSILQVIETAEMLNKMLTGKEVSEQELVYANHLAKEDLVSIRQDEIQYTLIEDDEDIYRHTYQEELQLLSAVEEGRVEDALKKTMEMDGDIGKLSQDDVGHWRTVLVIGATLCARAAIRGGISPYNAYRISGYYINKGSNCKDAARILSYRNQAVEELTTLVAANNQKKHLSSYTEQCKDYIRQHFREKIYLEDLAEHLGISSSYLSRLFKKETGENLQDFIIDVRLDRACNLLVYSEESISKIATYVNFPSQSYFGRIFKEREGMTPREYREKYKPTEFVRRV